MTASLSARELLVLRRSAAGDTYDSMAVELGITWRAVGKMASRMFEKIGAKSMPHAVSLAHTYGLIEPEPGTSVPVLLPVPLVQVLELVADGRTNAEIARLLVRSEHTVVDQVKEARRRLGARDRAHAAALAVALRIVRVKVPDLERPAVVDAA